MVVRIYKKTIMGSKDLGYIGEIVPEWRAPFKLTGSRVCSPERQSLSRETVALEPE
jgi:hypothetical protein